MEEGEFSMTESTRSSRKSLLKREGGLVATEGRWYDVKRFTREGST